jgi:hypothetical protein
VCKICHVDWEGRLYVCVCVDGDGARYREFKISMGHESKPWEECDNMGSTAPSRGSVDGCTRESETLPLPKKEVRSEDWLRQSELVDG